ncbi:hypothetical protein NMG60_11027135 [Bertholletia excelsa]
MTQNATSPQGRGRFCHFITRRDDLFSPVLYLRTSNLPALMNKLHSTPLRLFLLLSFMGIQLSQPIILIMAMLALSQLSNGRLLYTTATEETGKNFQEQSYSQSSSHTISATDSQDPGNLTADPVYEVSHRTVPGGPNPLHN